MMEITFAVLGFFVAFVGMAGIVLSGSILRIAPILTKLFEINPRVDGTTLRAFTFLFLSGVLSISYAASRGKIRGYRFLAFLSAIFAALSLASFTFKMVNLGPDWLGVELVGAEGKTEAVSLGILALSILNFFSTLIGLVLEMGE